MHKKPLKYFLRGKMGVYIEENNLLIEVIFGLSANSSRFFSSKKADICQGTGKSSDSMELEEKQGLSQSGLMWPGCVLGISKLFL